MKLELNIKEIFGLNDAQKHAYRSAAEAMLFELNDEEEIFWNEVKDRYKNMTWKNGYNFEEFKALIMSGKDMFEEVADNEIDISVTAYYSFRNVVGYTTMSTYKTWINRKFIGMRIDSFAGHIFHEALHNYNFVHPNVDRQSLVYQCGDIMKECVRERFKLVDVPQRKSLWRRFVSWIF